MKVHYNSDKPAQLQAHTYAQGTDIHIASGQEKHLSHEVWHVVQQKQGRVQPTTQFKIRSPINADSSPERKAELMGTRALNFTSFIQSSKKKSADQRYMKTQPTYFSTSPDCSTCSN